MKIQKNEIIAIGDNINDEKMINNAGLGIVMGESALSVRQNKNIVTKSNNENGVAYAIYNYILK